VAIQWNETKEEGRSQKAEGKEEDSAIQNRYEHLEKLRQLAANQHLLLQEEARPVGIALFGEGSLIVHLGFDQAGLAAPDWYSDVNHPYVKAIGQILAEISTEPNLRTLEFMVSSGGDPLKTLQVQLDRETFVLSELTEICDRLEPQKIYSFAPLA
ncbi:MAG TPA: bifunctional 3,4-dihydroxy-2-butanone-4-phosphate synthase/GTP cyclohydrolase II, partial [Microcoleus sp.]|nr:bifunctional 3,4-dihydroxy-2-butanone-4-phosphate synthase/GTP cyclohydrolase II [Microcoleus sp.]